MCISILVYLYTKVMSTIAVISTASGSGAIALVRVSGPDAVSIVDKIFVKGAKETRSIASVQNLEAWTVHFGQIVDGDEVIDEVLISIFKAPNSYTGEDLIEISCHGSVYIQQSILQLLIRHGASMAGPGEFTQRAYLNGKLDLTQAEAVSDLIASSSRAAQQVAMDQMRGGFSKEIQILRNQLLEFVSLVELELDFAEEDVEFADRSHLKELVSSILQTVNKLLKSFSLGNAIKEGVPVAIVGETNVGKSTLLNALLKDDKAIVSDIAGTTRDVIEDTIQLDGLLFRFIDTAGLRHTDDHIETMGIERSYQQLKKARIILLVTDPTAPEEQSLRWVSSIREKIRDDQHLIILVNKGDLGDLATKRQVAINNSQATSHNPQLIVISAKSGMGLAELEESLLSHINLKPLEDHDVIITNVRHYEVLGRAKVGLERVIGGLETGITADFLAQDIREVIHILGEITGQISTDEVLGNIFRNFCIGK